MEMVIAIYSLVLAAFILWTVGNRAFMPSLPAPSFAGQPPKISVLVPLRNEEENVETLVAALKGADYPQLEFLLLNDGSEDRTNELLHAATDGDGRFTILQGTPLPDDWIGKVHACHQLQQAATGDHLLFIDADISFTPEAISQSLTLADKTGAALVTGFPAFQVPPFLSKLLVPMLHFVIHFHLPLVFANYSRYPLASAANGMWMFFEREAYMEIGGHASVKDSLVEDVHLARRLKQHGKRVILANITRSVTCRMYTNNPDVWEGFLKNSFTGIGRSSFLALFLTLFYTTFYFAPLPLAIAGIFTFRWLWCVPYLLIVLQQAFVMYVTRQQLRLAWLMPLQAGAMIAVLLTAMWKHIRKQPYSWKGRKYS
ncbi:glycosyltransferase family 2 protein [Planomicrobium sp. YIM 101495]|uniref:glycosyltransferase n=1 Tax=Planomicrobium sp. YIM 101495 TaxID=2665160 RepID=UPI001E49F931|nr:glycosyltransferase family 2 protein [Planomicrobium sp. YIM 101495]